MDIIEQLYDVAAGRLGAYGYLLTGSQAAGEELVQAAIVKVFVKRRRLTNLQQAESYVRTTMRNLHIDALRRERSWRRAAPRHLAADVTDSSEALAGSDAAARALAQLPPRVRAAVVLRYLDGLSVAEVAHEMGIGEGTAKRYLADGRAALGPALGVTDDAEPEPSTNVIVNGRQS
jgi:RNA polymerase sigma-70 factor (ECF subfamily)